MCEVQVGFQNQEKWNFWTRLVACGHRQISRVDFSENYSLVVHNVTFRYLLVLKIVYGFIAKIADIVTAFLLWDLDEEIFMDCPKELEEANSMDGASMG